MILLLHIDPIVDGFGQLIRENSDLSGDVTRSVSHTYDKNGNPKTITRHDSQVFAYDYDVTLPSMRNKARKRKTNPPYTISTF